MNNIQKIFVFYLALYITCAQYDRASGEPVDPVEDAMEEAKVAAEPMKEEDRRDAKWEVHDGGLDRWDHFQVLDPLESGFNNEGGFQGHFGSLHSIQKRVLPVQPMPFSDEKIYT